MRQFPVENLYIDMELWLTTHNDNSRFGGRHLTKEGFRLVSLLTEQLGHYTYSHVIPNGIQLEWREPWFDEQQAMIIAVDKLQDEGFPIGEVSKYSEECIVNNPDATGTSTYNIIRVPVICIKVQHE
jgi:hypothetical protein